MAAGATYEPIATTTLGTAQTNITFSSIPSTYTDLRIIFVYKGETSATSVNLQFNSDTGTNYSFRGVYGNGTSAASASLQTRNQINIPHSITTSTTIPTFTTIDIFSYAGSTYKTILALNQADQNGSGGTEAEIGLWRNTAAITTIGLTAFSGNLAVGTTATLYGIKAA